MSRIYISCLASYNNGRLYGRWIDVSSNAEEMQSEIAEMLKASPMPNAEEWVMHDYDDIGKGWGEWPDLEKLASFAEVAEYANVSIALVAKYVACVGADDASEFADAYVGQMSVREYADQLADDTYDTSHYFDYNAHARDVGMGMMEIDGHLFYSI